MTDKPVQLDERRGTAALKATGIHRQRLTFLKADEAASRRRQEELEQLFLAPAETWHEAAVKAQYLIRLYAATPEARDPKSETVAGRHSIRPIETVRIMQL